jgi:large subunit ribosomal protein L21
MTTETKVKKAPTETVIDSKFAVIKAGGKQYVVKVGDVLKVEKIDAEDIKDGKVIFEEVLLVDDGKKATIGTPFVKGVSVVADVLKEIREKKVVIIRYRAKSRHFKKNGHRQPKTFVKVTAIK